jgi:hypothetical protein
VAVAVAVLVGRGEEEGVAGAAFIVFGKIERANAESRIRILMSSISTRSVKKRAEKIEISFSGFDIASPDRVCKHEGQAAPLRVIIQSFQVLGIFRARKQSDQTLLTGHPIPPTP